MFEIMNIKDREDFFEKSVQFFWKHWGSSTNYHFYRDCMAHSNNNENSLPQFFIALHEDRIIGSFALLRNDLNSRQDIFPWFACLYVDPDFRGKNLGSILQNYAFEQAYSLNGETTKIYQKELEFN